MAELIVYKGLKSKYWLRSLWWKIIVCNLFTSYSKGWKEYPLVAYSLAIDIAIGTMRLHYLKYGFYHVYKRITTYNDVLADRIVGKKKKIFSLNIFNEKRN